MTKSTRKFVVWTSLVVTLIAAVVGGAWALFGTHELTFTTAELQQRINERLPITTKRGDVTVTKVDIDLSGGKIGLLIDASARKLRTDYAVSAQTVGTVRYDAQRGSFFFAPSELRVTQVTANGRAVGEKVGRFIDRWASKSQRVQEHKDELMVAAEELAQSAIQSAVAKGMERIPVYTFADTFKGQAARMSLKSVTVNDGSITVTLSFAQLTLTLVGFVFIGILALGLAIALMAAPGGGLAILLLGAF